MDAPAPISSNPFIYSLDTQGNLSGGRPVFRLEKEWGVYWSDPSPPRVYVLEKVLAKAWVAKLGYRE